MSSQPRPDDTAVSDREYRALTRFRHALRAFIHFSEEAARQAGLTPAQHQLLLTIKGSEAGPPTIGEVAEWLKLRHHSAVELVDRAATAGLVERVADATEARFQRLILTPLGEDKLAGLSALHREELRRFREEMFEHLVSLG
jgi:DNA-binding MarR family transcriptional regulator